MNDHISVEPLPYKTRKRTFILLVVLFVVVLPFLYLYATGYRFDFQKPTQLISTGGLYLAVERTGAEIYMDNELVRETRTFRKAFYAQNIDVGTHRVHVQKEGYHTWVKELPVYKHLVTEAEAFNLPLVPKVRVISEFQNANGTQIVRTPLLVASTTQPVIVATSTATSTLVRNQEYKTLISHFVASTSIATTSSKQTRFGANTQNGTTTKEATTTLVSGGVQLAMVGDDLFATWVGSHEEMPYYYCALAFPRYSTSTPTSTNDSDVSRDEEVSLEPLQKPVSDATCTPTIQMDRKWQNIHSFNFYPGSTDLVLEVLDDGIYAVEIDNRSWQNMQPVLMGKDLRIYIENGNLYVYDGHVMYQVVLDLESSLI